MLPQNCSDIHFSLISNNKSNESSNNYPLYNNICCFDFLINIKEFYSDNMTELNFYKKFIKLIYELDKQNVLDFPNYNRFSLVKFILILNKTSCYYYIWRKIKYSKYLCNLSVKVSQIVFQSDENIIPMNIYQNNDQFSNDIMNKYLISTIYNNACCNYFKTFSYNKSLKFLDYSYKNIEENDINDKLIYYNNSIIIESKNIINYDNVNRSIKILDQLIQSQKKYFNDKYLFNSYYNNGDNSEMIDNKIKDNENDYKSFKLLSFIINNYILFIENIFKQKEQAKYLSKINYEYIYKFLGKSSFEAQRLLIRLKDDIKIKSLNFKFEEENKNIDKESKKIKGKNGKFTKRSEKDINFRLNNILEKIEEFEGILQNETILNIIKEKNSNNEKTSKNAKEQVKNRNILFDDKNENNTLNITNKDNNIIIKDDKKNNKENINQPKKEKEKITFDMMDNIIEEFKKETQEKLELNKKLKEESDKKKLEINNKKINDNKDIKKETTENINDTSSPKKVPKIKKLFQKVIGSTQKEPKQTKLGELFQSLMDSKCENKNEEIINKFKEQKDEIKVDKEKEDNFINLDDDEDEVSKDNEEEINIKNKKEDTEEINNNSLINNQNIEYGFKINIHLDPSSYSYEANTLYQENEN